MTDLTPATFMPAVRTDWNLLCLATDFTN